MPRCQAQLFYTLFPPLASANVSPVHPSPSHWRQPFFRARSCINTVWVIPDLGSSRVRLHSQPPDPAFPVPALLGVFKNQHFVIIYNAQGLLQKQLLVLFGCFGFHSTCRGLNSTLSHVQCRLNQTKCVLFKDIAWFQTYQILKESFQLFGLILQAESHPLPHLGGCAYNSSPHDGSDILHQDPPVHLTHQRLSVNQSRVTYNLQANAVEFLHMLNITKCLYLVRWKVHPSELLEVLFNAGFDGLEGLCVIQPFSLYQFVKERLEQQQTKFWLTEHIKTLLKYWYWGICTFLDYLYLILLRYISEVNIFHSTTFIEWLH